MPINPNFTDGAWNLVSTAHMGGDPNGDLLWQNIADQSLLLWQQDGATTTQTVALPSLDGFVVAAVGDFDGDGIGDAFLRNDNANKVLLSTTGNIEEARNNASDRTIIEATDLTGSGTDDLVWFKQSTGQIYTWEYADGVRIGTTTFGSGYAVDDIFHTAYEGTDLDSFRSLWFDTSANEYQITSYTDGVGALSDTFTVTTGRSFVNEADLNGDGNTDFLFIDQAGFGIGDVEVVFTDDNGNSNERIDYDADLFAGVDFHEVGDFDGDGRFELISADPVDGDLSIYNAIGSDQFSREVYGGNQADLIDGQEGNDSIYGFDGDDLLLGGDGRDLIWTGEGDDRASGGLGDDSVFGETGDDTLVGGAGNDWLSGGDGRDTLEAGNGTDFVFGDDGDDYLLGGAFGFDHLRGGEGDDLIRGGSDRGISEGGAGNDNMIGSSSNDVMFGGIGDDYIVGGLSQDTIFGGSGDDVIIGVDVAGTSGTDDTAYGGLGSDYFYLGNDDGNFYTGSGELYIMDFSTSMTTGDWLMLNGTASSYNFVDTGSTIQVQQSSDSNIIAILETSSSAGAVAAKAIYIG